MNRHSYRLRLFGKLLLLGALGQPTTLSAHDPDQGYLKIERWGSYIHLQAELPWTIRNAVYAFDPSLPTNATQAQLDAALFAYIRQHVRLMDPEGNPLPLLTVQALDKQGHTHQFDIEGVYQGHTVQTIHNTLLWNVVEHPKHAIEVVHLWTTRRYDSDRKHETITLTSGIYNPLWVLAFWLGLGLSIVMCLLFLTFVLKKRSA